MIRGRGGVFVTSVDMDKSIPTDSVVQAALRARGEAVGIETQARAAFANPSILTGWNPGHQRVGGHIFRDDCARGDHRELADAPAAENRRIRADAGTRFNECGAEPSLRTIALRNAGKAR